jgi:hypothetical protein
LIRLTEPGGATALRLRVREAAAEPVIAEFSAFS